MDTAEILALIKHVADEVINPRFHALNSAEVFEKNPGDFVTVADRQAEAELTNELSKAYPNALIVGEEASFDDDALSAGLASAEHAFTIDPIDGTGNFVKGHPDHAVMIAELRRGELTRSWIWQPQHEKAYVAERGAGLTLNGELMSQPPISALPRGATSRKMWRGFDADAKLATVTRSNNCAGVDYAQLAHGVMDYFVYFMPKTWDHLPGQLMMMELGGDILRLDGTKYPPQGGTEPIFACPDKAALTEIVALWRERWHVVDAQ